MSQDEQRHGLTDFIRGVNKRLWRVLRVGSGLEVPPRPVWRDGVGEAPHPAPQPAGQQETQPLKYCGHEGNLEALEERALACASGLLSEQERDAFLACAAQCPFCSDRLDLATALLAEAEALGLEQAAASAPTVAEPSRSAALLELVFSVVRDVRHAGRLTLSVVRMIGLELLDTGCEPQRPIAQPLPARGAAGSAEDRGSVYPTLSCAGQVGTLAVEYSLSARPDGYLVELLVREADGCPTTRPIEVEREVGSGYVGTEPLSAGRLTIDLPASFGSLVLRLLENGKPLDPPICITEQAS